MGAIVVKTPEGAASSLVLGGTGKDLDLDGILNAATKLGELQSINASFTKITDDHLKIVAQISTLGDLQLTDTGITDGGVRHLTSLSGLDSLVLAGTKITSACLADIGQLKELMNLQLNNTAISGGFEPLVGLDQLTLLVVGELTISEEDAKILAQIPNLQRIDLTGATLSETAIETLKSKIPHVATGPGA